MRKLQVMIVLISATTHSRWSDRQGRCPTSFPVPLIPGNEVGQVHLKQSLNRLRSICPYSNMAPRLSGQTSIFGVAFFVSLELRDKGNLKNLQF